MDKTELKNKVIATGSHFFDRKSLKFFGDTMGNYAVSKEPVNITTATGDVYCCWELRRINPVLHRLKGSAYFDCITFRRVLPAIVVEPTVII